MPRAESTKHSTYQSGYSPGSNSQYPAGSNTPSPPPTSSASTPTSSTQSSSNANANASAQKKKHVCPTCERPFSTSGHLARHSRVHTGERNHKCPFPGCETRCSRQDNLQQHYRIHLSPGSRRSSTRSAITRAMNGSNKRNAAPSPAVEAPASPPPLSSPPALEQARIYAQHSPAPDSPPPLAQATLPATAHMPPSNVPRSSGSPEAVYNSSGHPLAPSHNTAQNMNGYSYRNGPSTYQDQSQNTGFTYVHTNNISHSNNSSGSFSSYSNAHGSYHASLPHINTSSLHPQHHHDSPNPTPITSRHSISHISHPQSYAQNQPHSAGPASPASSHSVSSHASNPATPSYPYHEEQHSYHHQNNGMMADHGLSNGQMMHSAYSTVNVQQHSSRFDSPPPTLAPIQEPRYTRRDERHPEPHSNGSYMHHAHSMPNDYSSYHHSMAMNNWKAESGMRKGVGALVQ